MLSGFLIVDDKLSGIVKGNKKKSAIVYRFREYGMLNTLWASSLFAIHKGPDMTSN